MNDRDDMDRRGWPEDGPQEVLTPEQIAEDIRRFAQENRYRGGLYELDREKAKESLPGRRPGDGGEIAGGKAVNLKRKRACRDHPDRPAPWVCTDCDAAFCGGCVSPMLTFFNPAHGGYEHASAVCPACKGRCVNVRFEVEKQARIDRKQEEEFRSAAYRTVMFWLLSLPFIAGLIVGRGQVSFKLDLAFILFVFAALNFGFLRGLGLHYKSFFARVLPGYLGMTVFFYLLAAKIESAALRLLVDSALKYVLLSGWCAILLLGVERAAEFFGFIYSGSQEAEGWTRKDRVIMGFIIAIIALGITFMLAAIIRLFS